MSTINALRKQLFGAYGFTLRKTSNVYDVTRDTYAERLSYFTELGCRIIDVTYEYTSGLHCHGIIEVSRNLGFHRLRCRGWSFKYEPIYDMDGWIRYMYKDQVPTIEDQKSELANFSRGVHDALGEDQSDFLKKARELGMNKIYYD